MGFWLEQMLAAEFGKKAHYNSRGQSFAAHLQREVAFIQHLWFTHYGARPLARWRAVRFVARRWEMDELELRSQLKRSSIKHHRGR